MLPFTTYSIPEGTSNQTPHHDKWLYLVTASPLSDAQKLFLEKITTAVKASFTSDVLHINIENHPVVEWSRLHSPALKLIISFGVLPSRLGLWIDLANPGLRFLESTSFLLTIPVDQLESNANAKKELWKHMKLYMEMESANHA